MSFDLMGVSRSPEYFVFKQEKLRKDEEDQEEKKRGHDGEEKREE